MNLVETIFIGIGLAMDAFAVSICKGLSMFKMSWRKAIKIGLYFGIFQMMMPIIGYLLGIRFAGFVEKIDHWLAFILLGFIGIKMIKESFSEEENTDDKVDFRTMTILAIATSIDALAIGITYAFLETNNILMSFSIIGLITFVICIYGVLIGNKFGNKYGSKAEFVGGLILLFIGIKILIEHTIL